jgi:hypothetical protein
MEQARHRHRAVTDGQGQKARGEHQEPHHGAPRQEAGSVPRPTGTTLSSGQRRGHSSHALHRYLVPHALAMSANWFGACRNQKDEEEGCSGRRQGEGKRREKARRLRRKALMCRDEMRPPNTVSREAICPVFSRLALHSPFIRSFDLCRGCCCTHQPAPGHLTGLRCKKHLLGPTTLKPHVP